MNADDFLAVQVLDEADRLLTPSFAKDLSVIFDNVPEKRQSLLFTATITDSIAALQDVAKSQNKKPFVYQVKSK
jgi:ATP-dependent RNA helicase DDX49/DBP8